MQIIYFAPHLDDIAFSCGGYVWQQIQDGHDVSICTLFAGDPPSCNYSEFAIELHRKWGLEDATVSNRRKEDIRSCEILGASYLHLDYPDCVYRLDPNTKKHLYTSEEAIFGPYHKSEELLIMELGSKIEEKISGDAVLVSPLAIGNHVDHQICRKIVETIRKPKYYYFDYPYVEKEINDLKTLLPNNSKKIVLNLSDEAIHKWQEAIEAHRSQISSFWKNTEIMRKSIQNYVDQTEGIGLITKI